MKFNSIINDVNKHINKLQNHLATSNKSSFNTTTTPNTYGNPSMTGLGSQPQQEYSYSTTPQQPQYAPQPQYGMHHPQYQQPQPCSQPGYPLQQQQPQPQLQPYVSTMQASSFGSGLEVLAGLDAVIIKQQVEALEILLAIETANQYKILAPDGRTLFHACEKSGTLNRMFMGTNRQLKLDIYLAGSNQPAMCVRRPFRVVGKYAEIVDANGNVMGRVRKHFGLKGKMEILDANDQTLYLLETSAMDILKHNWTITDARTNMQVGSVQKKWAGFLQEMYTDADNFALVFPRDADVRARGLLLSAVLFIDLSHFETNGNKQGMSFGI